MRLAFVHQHVYRELDDGTLVSEAFPLSVWQRYLGHFDSMTVIARKSRSESSVSQYVPSFGDRVSFACVRESSYFRRVILRRRSTRKAIREYLKGCDRLVARLPSDVSLMAIREARRMRIPYGVEIVGCIFDALWNSGHFSKPLALLSYLNHRRVIQGAPLCIYVTSSFLQRRYPTRGVSINGCSNVELPSIDDGVLAARLRRPRDRTLRIGQLSSFLPYKNHETSIKVGREMQRLNVPFQMEFVGARGKMAEYQELVREYGLENRIVFKGTLKPGDQVFSWLDSLDFYIHPSRQEGLPRAVLEAYE